MRWNLLSQSVCLQGYDPVPTGGTAAASQYGSLSAGNTLVMRAFKSPSGKLAMTSLAWK